METTGCPSMYATDLILTPTPLSENDICATNFIPWIVVLVVFSCGNVWVSIRRQRLHLIMTAKKKHSVPLMVALSWLTTIAGLLFIFIPFTGGNAANGGTLVLLSIVFASFGIKSLLLMKKLVGLGERIIPLSRKVLLVEKVKTSIVEKNLSSTNSVLRVMFSLGWLILVIQSLMLIVIDFAVPERNTIWITVALGLQVGLNVLLCICIVYQYQRCISAVRRTFGGSDGDMDAKLVHTVGKMRNHQLIILSLNIPSTIFYALSAASVIPRRYEVILVIIGTELMINLLIVRTQQVKPRTNPSSGEDSGVVVPKRGA